MLIFAFLLMFLSLVGVLAFAARELKATREASEREAVRLQLLAESSFNYIRARSLDDVAHSKHLKDTYDLQLEVLRKNYAKETAQQKENVPQEPQWVQAADGTEIDLRDYEVVS